MDRDIMQKLYDQLQQDYAKQQIAWFISEDMSADVPTFFVAFLLVNIGMHFTKVYTLTKIGEETCFMSRNYDEYREEIKQ
jgi:hypothetical protein